MAVIAIGKFVKRRRRKLLLVGAILSFTLIFFWQERHPGIEAVIDDANKIPSQQPALDAATKQEKVLNDLIQTVFMASVMNPDEFVGSSLGLNHSDIRPLSVLNQSRLEFIYKKKYEYKQRENLYKLKPCPEWQDDSGVAPAKNVTVYREYAPLKMLENLGFNVEVGGTYTPNCKPRQKIAIIIPFRNREEHLSVWLLHLHPFLQKQHISYTVFVINQVADCTFNKGLLMNTGFMEVAKIDRFDCFVFHDVDLLPQDDRIRYTCTDDGVRHLAYALEEWNYQELYGSLVGGAVAATWRQYIQANGYSNQFFGWGGEDDDFYLRLVRNEISITRYPISIAHYTMVQHHRDSGNTINRERYKLLRSALTTRMQDRDGLNNLVYSVQSIEKLPLFTRINILFTEQEVKAAKPYPLQFPYVDNKTISR